MKRKHKNTQEKNKKIINKNKKYLGLTIEYKRK